MLKMAEQSGCCHRFQNEIKAKIIKIIFCDFCLPTLYCIPKRVFGIYKKVRKKLFFSFKGHILQQPPPPWSHKNDDFIPFFLLLPLLQVTRIPFLIEAFYQIKRPRGKF